MSTIAIAPRQVAASRVAAASTGVASALSDTADVAWRNLLTQLRTPQALVFATIQPVIFVLLFRYAFGGAIHVPGTNYVDFLMPGIFAQTVAFGAVGTAVGLSGDLRTGILVRFRTLPMARIAVLGGRTVADLARNLLVVAVMVGVGFAAGFRSPHGADSLLAALGLVVAFGYAISWGFASLGLRVSDPEAAQAAAVPMVFLLVFTSAAFVPTTAMPGWLQAFGTHQPVDALVNAERALILGGPAAHDVLISLAWSGGLLVVFALLAARTYARMAVNQAVMRRRARIMRAVNVPMRAVLSLPFATPLSGNLMLISYTGRKSGKAYRQPVSYVRDGDVLLTPGGGRWTLNLADGRPTRIRLRGRDAPARPELVTDPAELERLLGVIAEKNPRAARFIPIPRRPDGRLDPDALDAALQHGFCIMRWHLAEQG